MWLSIITVSKNNCEGLKKTISSVVKQTFAAKEHIIIDGGSTDNSKLLIQEYSRYFNYWVSENDNGIYHAMNKGISKATGKYLLFLNSGDTLSNPNILAKVFDEIGSYKADIFYSDANFIDEEKKVAWLKTYPQKLNNNFFITSSLCHQTMLIQRLLFTQIGNYRESYSLSADWIFSFEAFKKSYTFKKIATPLSNYVLGGFSSNFKLSRQQRLNFIAEYYPEYQEAYQQAIRQKTFFERLVLKFRYIINNRASKQQKIAYQSYINSFSD